VAIGSGMRKPFGDGSNLIEIRQPNLSNLILGKIDNFSLIKSEK